MRVLAYVALGAVFCGNVLALEKSAGANTVNASQVGIDAKLDASNNITAAAISKITSCGQQHALYDPSTNTCVDVVTSETDPVASPQVTSNKNSIKAIATCASQGKLWNGGGCVSPPGSNIVVSAAATAESRGTPQYSNWVTGDYCALDYAKYNLEGHSSTCSIEKSGSSWRAVATGRDTSNRATCGIICFTKQ